MEVTLFLTDDEYFILLFLQICMFGFVYAFFLVLFSSDIIWLKTPMDKFI